MSISGTRIVDRDERVPSDQYWCEIEPCLSGDDPSPNATWRRLYVGGEVAYFCDQHIDSDQAGGDKPMPAVPAVEVLTCTSCNAGWHQFYVQERGPVLLLRCTICLEVLRPGYDAALALATPLAEALATVLSWNLLPLTRHHPDGGGRLRVEVAQAGEALAAYRAATAEPS